MIQVARDGKVIFQLESEDEFWAKVTSGEILPTDHCWMPDSVSWRQVSQIQERERATQNAPAARRTIQEETDLIQLRIRQLVEAPPLRRPEACAHCGNNRLKTAQLVYEQGTRVGMSYDFGDKDISIHGSKNLQAMGISPPSAPGDATQSLGGGCFAALLSFVLFLIINGMLVTAFADTGSPGQPDIKPSFQLRALLTALSAIVTALFFLWLQRYYLPIRMRRRADKLLAKAHEYNNWKNTWICDGCGRVTVRTAKGL